MGGDYRVSIGLLLHEAVAQLVHDLALQPLALVGGTVHLHRVDHRALTHIDEARCETQHVADPLKCHR